MVTSTSGVSPFSQALQSLGVHRPAPQPASDPRTEIEGLARQTGAPANVLFALAEADGGDMDRARRNADFLGKRLAGGAKIEDAVAELAGDAERGAGLMSRSYDIADELYPEPAQPEKKAGIVGKIGTGITDFAKAAGSGAVNMTGGAVQALGAFADDAMRAAARAEMEASGGDPSRITGESILRSGSRAAADAVRGVGDGIAGSISEGGRKAMQGSQPGGEVFSPSTWTAGDDPSAYGYLLNTAQGLGSMIPVAAASAVAGPAGAAVMGGLGAAGEGAQAGRDFVDAARGREGEAGPAAIEAMPGYRALRDQGLSHEDAAAELARLSESEAAARQAIPGTLGGAATGKILSRAEGVLNAGGRAARAAKKGVAGAIEEGAQEAAEGMASQSGIAAATGADLNTQEGSFGNFVLGALSGGAMGAGAGLIGPGETEREQSGDAVSDDAGAAEGGVPLLPAPENGGTIFGMSATHQAPGSFERDPGNPIRPGVDQSGAGAQFRPTEPMPRAAPDPVQEAQGGFTAQPDTMDLPADARALPEIEGEFSEVPTNTDPDGSGVGAVAAPGEIVPSLPADPGAAATNPALPVPRGPVERLAQSIAAATPAPTPQAPIRFPEQKPGGAIRLGDPASGQIIDGVFLGETEAGARVRVQGREIDLTPEQFDTLRDAVPQIEDARKRAEQEAKAAGKALPAPQQEDAAHVEPGSAGQAPDFGPDGAGLRLDDGQPGSGAAVASDGHAFTQGREAVQSLDQGGMPADAGRQPAGLDHLGDVGLGDDAGQFRGPLTAADEGVDDHKAQESDHQASLSPVGAPQAPQAWPWRGKKMNTRTRGRAISDYFAPGNIVESYGGGRDRVVSFDPKAGAITVEAVEQRGGEWVPAGERRTHSTLPEDRALRRGPVARVPSPIDAAAAEAHPEPTEAQKEAGNYRKGHVRWNGLDLSIENAKGSERRGTGPDGTEWSVTMPAHYGYFRGTEASDGDHVDFYMGDNPDAANAYVIDQVDAETGAYDEAKVMLGFDSAAAARAAHEAAFSDGKGAARLGGIKKMPVADLKAWLASDATKMPVSMRGRRAAAQKPAPAPQKRPLMAYVTQRLGGINPTGKVAEELRHRGVNARTAPGLWRRAGRKELDNIPASDHPDLEALVGRSDDGLYLDPARIIDAIVEEVAGRPQPLGEQAVLQQQARATEEAADHARLQEADHVIVPPADDPRPEDERRSGVEGAVDDFLAKYAPDALTESERGGIIEILIRDGGDIDALVVETASQRPIDDDLRATESGLGEIPFGDADGGERSGAERDREGGSEPAGDDPGRLPAEERGADGEGRRDGVTPPAKAAKIEDFGEKIAGARKDVWASYADHMRDAADIDVSAEPLSKSWPAPDYEKLVEAGVETWKVSFIRAARDSIPTKPQKSWRLQGWVEAVTAMRGLARDVMDGKIDQDRLRNALLTGGTRTPSEILGQMKLYEAVGHGKSLKGMSFGQVSYSMLAGVRYNPHKVLWEVSQKAKAGAFSNMPSTMVSAETEADAIAAFKRAYAGLDQRQAKAQKARKWVIMSHNNRAWFSVGTKIGSTYVQVRRVDDVKEARRVVAEESDALQEELDRLRDIPADRRAENAPRVGIDHRSGADATPERFGETFGFRGIQFGNWVEGKRRQQDLNDAYDALMDLAGVLDLPPRALSLNGTLGMAFGARGAGGVSPAAAHYEPGQVVINLTKMNGAGSLAHEWFHALDNYFAKRRTDGKGGDYITDSRYPGSPVEGVRPEVMDALVVVRQAIGKTGLKDRSANIDKTRSKAYWSTGIEMHARAFESYVIAKLQDQSLANDYLANVVEGTAWQAQAELSGLGDSYPYLKPDELEIVRPAFDALFDAIQARETDRGTELYQRDMSGLKGLNTGTKAFRDWFGDSAVVDADGEPLVVYHGSPDAPLDDDGFEFETGRQARTSDDPSNAFYFADDRQAAQTYAEGGETGAFYLSIQSPLDLRQKDGRDALAAAMNPDRRYGIRRDDDGRFSHVDDWIDDDGNEINPLPDFDDFGTIWDWAAEVSHDNANALMNSITEWAKENDYDGLIFSDGNRGELSTSYVAFDPAQIKSVNNRGTWDANDPRIMYQHDASEPVAALTGNELGEWADIWQLGKKAAAWYRNNLLPESGPVTVTNAGTGWTIEFNSKGANKIGGRKGEDIYRAIVALPEILKKGRLVASDPDAKGRPDIKAVHKLAAKVRIAGRDVGLIVTIRETRDGRFHYDLSKDRADDSGGRSETALRHGDAKLRSSALEGAPAELNLSFDGPEINPAVPASAMRGLADTVTEIMRRHGLEGRVAPVIVRQLLSRGGVSVQGSYSGGTVRVSATAADPTHTARHEIIHALRDPALWGRRHGLFTVEEWQALARAARRNPALRQAVEAAYPDLSTPGQTEEMVAEMYADWARGRDANPPGPVRAALERIASFFRAVAAALRGEGFVDAAQVMERIASGEIGGRGPDGMRREQGDGATPTMYQSVQTASVQIDPSTPVDVVVIEDAVPDAVDWRGEREWLREHLQGKEFVASDGAPVRISGISKKLTSSNTGNPVKQAAIRNLPRLIESAVVYSREADDKGRDNLSYAYAATVARIGGEDYSVSLSYRVDGEGKRAAYHLLGYEMEKRPGGSSGDLAEASSAQPTPERNHTIADVVADFNRGNPPLFQRDLSALKEQLSRSKGRALGMIGDLHWKRTPKVFSEWMSSKMTDAMGKDARWNILGLVPGHALFTELGKGLPAAQEYLRIKHAMDAERNEWQAKSAAKVDHWIKTARRSPKSNAALMDLMHETTMLGLDPTKPDGWKRPADDEARRMLAGKPSPAQNEWARITLNEAEERREKWEGLRARFEALPKQFRELYSEIRDTYAEAADASESALLDNLRDAAKVAVVKADREHAKELERIRDEGLTGAARDEALDKANQKKARIHALAAAGGTSRMKQLRQMFESNRLSGPYFPLARFGNYFVTLRDEAGKVTSFSRFEKEADQKRWMREAEQKGLGKVEHGVLGGDVSLREQVDPRFLADVETLLMEAGASREMMDAVWQRWLETLPDQSLRTNRIHRKNRLGFNKDGIRAFSSAMFHAAHQTARLRYGTQMEEELAVAEEQAKSAPDPNRAGFVVREMKQRHAFTMAPTNNQWVTKATTTAFIWSLAANPAAAAINLTQTTVVGVPLMAARYRKAGVSGVTRELAKASRDFMRGQGKVAHRVKGLPVWTETWSAENSKALSGDEKAAMKAGYDLGIMDKTQAHDLAAVADSGVEYNPTRERVMRAMSWGFHHAERFNREVTFLAAYRLGRQEGLPHDAAVSGAAAMTWKCHFDVQNSSRPRAMQGDTAKVLTIFRSFQVNMLWRLFRDMHQTFHGADAETRREARAQLVGVSLSMMAHAGFRGVWGYALVTALLALFFPSDDDDMDAWLQDALLIEGDGLGVAAWNWTMGLALNGVPGHALGVDLTNRIGMPELWIRGDDRDREGDDLWHFYTDQLLGPAFGILGNGVIATSMALDGQYWRAFEKAAPAFARNPVKGVRYASEGVTTYNGDPLIEDVSPWQVLMQMQGFAPAEVAERYRINSRLKNREKEISDRRSGIMREMGDAMRKGEPLSDTAVDQLREFNREFPEWAITADSLRQSVRSRQRASARNELGVSLNPKLNDRLRAEQPPALY